MKHEAEIGAQNAGIMGNFCPSSKIPEVTVPEMQVYYIVKKKKRSKKFYFYTCKLLIMTLLYILNILLCI